MSTSTSTSTTTSARRKFTNFSRRFNRKREDAIPEEEKVTASSDEPSTPSPSSPSYGRDDDINTSPLSDSTSGSPFPSLRLPAAHSRRHSQSHSRHSSSSIMTTTPGHFTLPDLPWLCGTWHVTHSTLPMWRNKRNVRITYTRLTRDRLDDTVTYQSHDSAAIHTVRGVDTPAPSAPGGTYLWRGKGLLKVASSRWEVLGWGGKDDTGGGGEQWVVTYFAKTMFTPAGVDIYSRDSRGLSPATLDKLRRGLMRIDRRSDAGGKGQKSEFGRLVDQIFEVKRDAARAEMWKAS